MNAEIAPVADDTTQSATENNSGPVQHSPTPWFQWADKPLIYTGKAVENSSASLRGSFTRVADCEQDLSDSYPGFREVLERDDEDEIEEFIASVNKANTERIIACVNACEGLSNESLASLGQGGLREICYNAAYASQLFRAHPDDAKTVRQVAAAIKKTLRSRLSGVQEVSDVLL